jgi:Flp pilus assembly protein TadB
MPSAALPGLLVLTWLLLFTLAIVSLGFPVPAFLSATLLITGLFVVFAEQHLRRHLSRTSRS